MANDFSSNITRQLIRTFLKQFDSKRVLSKNVNTQLFDGKFNPSSGDTVDVKRPTDYTSSRTSDGDLTGLTQDIKTGKATANVQDLFSVLLDYNRVQEALEMDQLDQLLAPAAQRIVTDFETDFAAFMMANAGLLAGDVTKTVAGWDDIAEAGAVMEANGIPQDGLWNYAGNSFMQRTLASDQRSLGAADNLVRTSNDMATISSNFAGMRVMTATTLASLTTSSIADRAGTIDSNPDVTYDAARNTMTQSIAVTGFGFNLVVKAGEVLQIAGRNRLNLSTRKIVLDNNGAVLFTGTVVSDVTLDGSGEGTIVITGPAIFEASGAYNTTDSAAVAGDVVTLLGAVDTLRQPNLFWHKDAFSIASIPIPKLQAQDSTGVTNDGLMIRVSKGSDIITNKQIVRFDFHPAYAVLNPFFAGQGFGV